VAVKGPGVQGSRIPRAATTCQNVAEPSHLLPEEHKGLSYAANRRRRRARTACHSISSARVRVVVKAPSKIVCDTVTHISAGVFHWPPCLLTVASTSCYGVVPGERDRHRHAIFHLTIVLMVVTFQHAAVAPCMTRGTSRVGDGRS